MPHVRIIGGGLAGCEAAWQIARRNVPVTLYEMRPTRPTDIHRTGNLAELVCSNSFRADKLDNAVGLLKEEMRRLDSLVMRVADAVRVPAGAALAVDRDRFAIEMTREIEQHPLITVRREEVDRIPVSDGDARPVIIATGPLTSDALSHDIREFVGQSYLYFYDAISPIVSAESIDMSRVFRASRWGRSLGPGHDASAPVGVEGADAGGEGDYLNCPMTAAEYGAFYDALTHAESATVHDFDRTQFFEGCLPIEVLAHRGPDTLRFGPMKPVGLADPRTGRLPYAVVQLRQDNLAGDHYSLVGFQTQLKWSDQARVLRLIPGLERAEFVRLGMVHRNTYINGPMVLAETWQARRRPDLLFAGQISGVEGYVESAASGLLAGISAASLARGLQPTAPLRTTAMGALAYYVSHATSAGYQPSNITFGIMEPLQKPPRNKVERKLAISTRALADLADWEEASSKK
ncbi:MAG: methylenetetrahydrofolate--tRNA-(uracil(54)-C(5))-methyltransferase (FADH(2)-oxidizing) TrmFO [Acidobacteria bacterium]|nr:methylenetetrahydrofolate--tRNA-(uracil(54)-C(5))-methyltransferase (FADH(2)-oxidizing) TrmFO [Acidobacteriota bacterium]